MIIGNNGNEYEATPENSVAFIGDTLLNGLYVDLDDDYLFLPAELMDDYYQLLEQLEAEYIPVCILEEYDYREQPFCYIINALCRMFRDEVEVVTNDQ